MWQWRLLSLTESRPHKSIWFSVTCVHVWVVRCGAVALSGWPVVIINNKEPAPPDRGDIPRASPLLFSVSKERHAAKIPCDVLSAEQQQNSVSQSLLSPRLGPCVLVRSKICSIWKQIHQQNVRQKCLWIIEVNAIDRVGLKSSCESD